MAQTRTKLVNFFFGSGWSDGSRTSGGSANLEREEPASSFVETLKDGCRLERVSSLLGARRSGKEVQPV